MNEKVSLLAKLEEGIFAQDREAVAATAKAIIASDIDVMEAVNVASAAITSIGEQFQCGELYLPQLMLAGETMKACMEVFSKHLGPENAVETKGKVVIAAVSGDIHDIGKNLVASMLTVNGYEIVDLGVNAAPMHIVDTAQRENADFIAMSALMTTSMPYQRDVLNLLDEMDIRKKFFVIVGGGPVTPEYASDINADGWGLSAISAVQLCDQIIEAGAEPASGNLYTQE
jgi:methylmalonyl-CoA mutase cobalamin-binding domain/chain